MKKVVIVGGGFAGLEAAKHLGRQEVDVVVVDRSSYFTFQPLLYQAALGVLAPSDITRPIRSILARYRNVTALMDDVIGIDRGEHSVILRSGGSLHYDYLILASGSRTSYFGNDDWRTNAPSLKTIVDAVDIRTRIFSAFEHAELCGRTGQATPDLRFIVVGGGPSGVELAGAIADISRQTLSREFRYVRPQDAQICLFEAGPSLLAALPPSLQQRGREQLEQLGVTVRTGAHITKIVPGRVFLDEESLAATLVLWAAGVSASPLAASIGIPTDRKGQVLVDAFLNPERERNVFVCGDIAAVTDHGKRVPGVAQAAMQMGAYAARSIADDLSGRERKMFHYADRGDMATIGAGRAVARIAWPFKAQLSGNPAWLAWLLIHLVSLTGADRRASVLFTWIYSYVTKTTRSGISASTDETSQSSTILTPTSPN